MDCIKSANVNYEVGYVAIVNLDIVIPLNAFLMHGSPTLPQNLAWLQATIDQLVDLANNGIDGHTVVVGQLMFDLKGNCYINYEVL